MKLFAAISKVDEENRMVWGYASTGARDSQDEIVTQDAIKGAWDDYMQFANVREMHQPSAVGVVKEYTFDDNGVFIGTHVVDDAAWTKVMAGVYKGFSIGGKKLPGGYDPITKTITALKLTEISLVDRPANPEALITMFKLADNPEGADMQKASTTVPLDGAATTTTQKPEDELLDLMAKGDLPVDKLLAFAKGLLVTVQVDGQGDNTGVNIDPDKAVGGNAVSNTPSTPVGAAGIATPKSGETSASMSGAAISATEKDPKDPTNSSNLSNKPNAAAKGTNENPLRKSLRALAFKGEDVAKGMRDVAEFAAMLQALQWLADGARHERDWEGDSSTVPEQIDTAVQTLAQVFLNMAVEELGELQPAVGGGTQMGQLTVLVERSEAMPQLKKFNDAVNVLKAGARNSAQDADRLQKAHDLLVDLGVTCKAADPAADATKAEPVGEVAKAADTAAPDLQALSETVATLQKSFGTQTDELKKANETIAALQKAVGAQPSAPKAALHAVGKDGVAQTIQAADEAAAIDPVFKQDGSVDELATAVKKVHVGGGRLTLGQR